MKKCYELLCNFLTAENVQVRDDVAAACKRIWKNDAPSKVLIFTWRVLLERVATRDALSRRGILHSQNDLCCVLCFRENESVEHLFLACNVVKSIWSQVFSWMGVPIVEPEDVISHFVEFGKMVKGRKQKGVKHLIWMAVVWNIWLARNKVIFQGEVASVPSIVSGIKDVAWCWFKARRGRNCGVVWSDWYNCPLGCFSSMY